MYCIYTYIILGYYQGECWKGRFLDNTVTWRFEMRKNIAISSEVDDALNVIKKRFSVTSYDDALRKVFDLPVGSRYKETYAPLYRMQPGDTVELPLIYDASGRPPALNAVNLQHALDRYLRKTGHRVTVEYKPMGWHVTRRE